jgi:hypothetical protein
MARGAGLQIDAGVPYLTDRVHCRGDHAREGFETVEFAESERGAVPPERPCAGSHHRSST